MTTFTATVQAPNCNYSRTAQTEDSAWADVIAYRRATLGQIQDKNTDGSLKFNDTGIEVMRDYTEEEIANVILGAMLQTEFANAADWKKRQITPEVQPATWTITA